MTSRSDRRRAQRETDRQGNRVGGITVRDLRAAEEELSRLAPVYDDDDETTFAVLLHDWQSSEHKRVGLLRQYQKITELKRRGRSVETDRVVQGYAEAKEDLQVTEEQLVSFLKQIDVSKAQALMNGTHYIAHVGIFLRVPDTLTDRISEALGLDSETRDEPLADSREAPATA